MACCQPTCWHPPSALERGAALRYPLSPDAHRGFRSPSRSNGVHRFLLLLLLVLLVSAGWYAFQHFELTGLDDVSLRRRTTVADQPSATPVPLNPDIETVRIAAFNIKALSAGKLRQPDIAEILVDVLRRFDVLAIQRIRSDDQPAMPMLIEQLNAGGQQFDFILSEPRVTTSGADMFAYVFDRGTVEADVRGAYTVNDPHNVLHRPPLVCAFRVRGPPKNEAFTFVLINVHAGPGEIRAEKNVLVDVYREVRRHSGGEDDIVMLGELRGGDQQADAWDSLPGGRFLLGGVPTDVARTTPYDNILLHQRSTTEFTGRAGVFDMMQEFDLTPDEALRISDRLPVWAEFTAYEQGLLPRAGAQRPSKPVPTRR